jgi:hypothetical protein
VGELASSIQCEVERGNPPKKELFGFEGLRGSVAAATYPDVPEKIGRDDSVAGWRLLFHLEKPESANTDGIGGVSDHNRSRQSGTCLFVSPMMN